MNQIKKKLIISQLKQARGQINLQEESVNIDDLYVDEYNADDEEHDLDEYDEDEEKYVEVDYKFGICGINEQVGHELALELIALGYPAEDIVGWYYEASPGLVEFKELGVELESYDFYRDTHLPKGCHRVYDYFVYIPSRSLSAKTMYDIAHHLVGRSLKGDEERDIQCLVYLGPQWDVHTDSWMSSMAVYPAIEFMFSSLAHFSLIYRHALLMEEVFSLRWMWRLKHSSTKTIFIPEGATSLNFCSASAVAQCVAEDVKQMHTNELMNKKGYFSPPVQWTRTIVLTRPEELKFTFQDVQKAVEKYFSFSPKLHPLDRESSSLSLLADRCGIKKLEINEIHKENPSSAVHNFHLYSPKIYQSFDPYLATKVDKERIGSLDTCFAEIFKLYSYSVKRFRTEKC